MRIITSLLPNINKIWEHNVVNPQRDILRHLVVPGLISLGYNRLRHRHIALYRT